MSATDTASMPTLGTPVRKGALLAIILTSYFMIVLDNSIVFTGLARIKADLELSTSGLSWVQTAYALTFGGFLLLGARAGDVLGRRRIFIVGLAIFGAASLAIGLAPSGGFLIGARAVQGIGAALLAPSSLALLTANFAEGRERTRAVAAYGTVAGLGASLGLVLGGVLADLTSWRVGFLVNVPIGIVLIICSLRFIRPAAKQAGRFDVAGAVASTVGMTALVYSVTRAADFGWSDQMALSLLASGLVILGAFVLIEWRSADPIVPLRVFANRSRAGAFIARMLFAGAIFGYFFFISQYMQTVLGFSPLEAGLAFLPMTVVQFAASMTVSRLTDRFGNPNLVVLGLAVTACGMLLLSRLGVDSVYWSAVALPMILLGLGQGLGFAPLTAAGVTAIDSRDAGAASGVVNVAHQLGGALGVSVMVAMAATTDASATPDGVAVETASGLLTGAALLTFALLAAVALIIPWRSRADWNLKETP